MDRQPITLTDKALERVKSLLEQSTEPAVGLRVGVNSTGCSGMSYFMEYATEVKDFEEVAEVQGIKIIIDPKSIMFLIGTELDFVEDQFGAHFSFKNPNEAGRCGCGESFHVESPDKPQAN